MQYATLNDGVLRLQYVSLSSFPGHSLSYSSEVQLPPMVNRRFRLRPLRLGSPGTTGAPSSVVFAMPSGHAPLSSSFSEIFSFSVAFGSCSWVGLLGRPVILPPPAGHQYAGFPVAGDFSDHWELARNFEIFWFSAQSADRSPGGADCSFQPCLRFGCPWQFFSPFL